MSVREGQVSFIALSTVATAAAFARAVGVQPTSTTEVSGPVGNGRSGRRSEVAIWSLDHEFDGGVNPVDQALAVLLSAFDGPEERLDAVRDSYELRVSWSGTPPSEQGGFWCSAPVVQRLARLGVEVHGAVYFDPAEERRPCCSFSAPLDVWTAFRTLYTSKRTRTSSVSSSSTAVPNRSLPEPAPIQALLSAASSRSPSAPEGVASSTGHEVIRA